MNIRMGAQVLALLGMLLLSQEAGANNVVVTNSALGNGNTGEKYVLVAFDITWENSWRTTANRDAAWVFVKFKAPGSNNWQHATLSATNSEHVPAAGSVVDAIPGGRGAFIYSAANQTGNVSYSHVQLRWNYGADGYSFAPGDPVQISVHAIEMVYCAPGAFYLGSTGSETARFFQYSDGTQSTNAYLITSEGEIPVGAANGRLYYSSIGGSYGDGAGPIPVTFPKGYNAFYCMKYAMSQGQYADFLNKLTAPQWTNRYQGNYGTYRQSIHGTGPADTVADAPDRECGYMSWMDGAAYADWAGLRPLTELEFEKACRGTAYPVANEFAWGTTVYTNLTGIVGVDGSGTETASPVTANAQLSHWITQTRVGIFATATSDRQGAGAGYYGAMELSGSCRERVVSAGHATGRGFLGTHGNGVLSDDGYGDNADWPGYSAGKITGATGSGSRSANQNNATLNQYCTSDRTYAAAVEAGRSDNSYGTFGWRGVRTAP